MNPTGVHTITRPLSHLALASALLAGSAQGAPFKVAGERAGHWDASIIVNWVEGDTLDFGGGGEAKVKDSWGWGIGIHYNFDNHWNLGFDMTFGQPEYSARFQTDPDKPGDFTTVNYNAYRFDGQLNGQYYILKGPITPYLQAGLGWTYMDSNIIKSLTTYCGGYPYYYPYCRTYANTFDETSFSYNVGIGLRWDASDLVFLKAAVIQQWIDTDGSPAPINGRVEVGFMF